MKGKIRGLTLKTVKFKIILLIVCFHLQPARAQQKDKPPNILFFLVDDLGWSDIEPFGSTFYETPNLKQLAGEAMVFTNAYTACPVCSPTRASIMTGKYPARMNTTDWFGAPQPEEILNNPEKRKNKPLLPAPYQEKLPLNETTVAEALKKAGYRTFIAGKWHLGETEAYWPERQGFDVNKGGYNRGHPYSYFSPYRNPRLKDGPAGEHLPARLADETNRFIAANKDQPFFAYFSFYSVHTPLQGRQVLVEKYEAKKERLGLTDKFSKEGKRKVREVQSHATYAAMIEAMDEAVGNVIEKLKAEGIYDNTVIIFFSDNGGLSTSEGHPTSNLPLRGGKGWLYEGGIRVPLLIKWPGHTGNGSVCEVPVISTDFYPTILQMAGLPLMPQQHKDGKSIVPLLNGQEMDRGPLFWHYPHYGNQGGAPGAAVRDGHWKLIRWYGNQKEQLFNLQKDIKEKNNVLDKYPDIADTLQVKLYKWLKEQDAQMPYPNPYYTSK